MKTNLKQRFYIILLIAVMSLNKLIAYGGTNNDGDSKNGWSVTEPFNTNVFVENKGQFDNSFEKPLQVKFAVNNNDHIYFTNTGLAFQLFKNNSSFEEEEKRERKNELTENDFKAPEVVLMNWAGCNANTSIAASEKTESYYTFGSANCQDIKAFGFKKIIYKNLYPKIDVEYTIPDEGGIKYKIIIHPGGDIRNIKMTYNVNSRYISINNDGSIRIMTDAGEITDHAPVCYSENKKLKNTSFTLKGNSIGFKINSYYDRTKDLVIDPWTTTPASLNKGNVVYDTEYDYGGNIYVSGGSIPYKVAKYSRNGKLLWTYSNPLSFGFNCYCKIAVDRRNEIVYIGEGIDWEGGPKVIKLNRNGTADRISQNLGSNNEIWVMYFNQCTSQLIGFGGGTKYDKNIKIISDTTLELLNDINFNTATNTHNDIAAVRMEDNGDFYALITTVMNNRINNHLMKSMISVNYNSPPAFDVPTGYRFDEFRNTGIKGFSSDIYTVRANALAKNNNYLFSYDGKTIKAWDKSTGKMLGSIIADAGYAEGMNRTHEGIEANDSNYVYAGGNKMVHIYRFDGKAFITLTPITENIPGEVYDISLDRAFDLLYVGGDGFLAVEKAKPFASELLHLEMKTGECPNITDIIITGGVEPYRYRWSTGDTTKNISAKPGTYTLMVMDNSCNALRNIGYINLTVKFKMNAEPEDTIICDGFSTEMWATGANKYYWSPDIGLSSSTGSRVTASPPHSTMYHVTGLDKNGCMSMDSVYVEVVYNRLPHPADWPMCPGDTARVYLPQTNTYTWFPPKDANSVNDSVLYVYPDSTSKYLIAGTDQYGCKDTITFIVFVRDHLDMILLPEPAAICPGDSIDITPYNANKLISWYPVKGTRRIDKKTVRVSPDTTTRYLFFGASCTCTDTAYITVQVKPAPVVKVKPDSVNVCYGTVINLSASGGFRYEWEPRDMLFNSWDSLVSGIATKDTIYTVRAYNELWCHTDARIPLKVKPLPDIVVTPGFAYICPGDSVTLKLSGGLNYVWEPSPYIVSNMTDSVLVKPLITDVYNLSGDGENGCSNIASVVVYIGSNELAVDPKSINVCRGEEVELYAYGSEIYTWSPAIGLNTTNGPVVICKVDSSRNYAVRGSDTQGCSMTDTIKLKVIEKPFAKLGNDTTICHDTSIILDPGESDFSYLWSDNTTQHQLTVNMPGMYSVTVYVSNTCYDSDSIRVSKFPVIRADLGEDRFFCPGTSTELDPNMKGIKYHWNNDSTTEKIIVKKIGTYSVTVTDIYGCSDADSVNVTYFPTVPVSLGLDTAFEVGTEYVLHAGNWYTEYTWQNNDHDSVFYPKVDGKYWVTVKDKWGCIFSDTVDIRFFCTGLEIPVPNIFTPNGDNLNDVFLPKGKCVLDYNLKIYDRYGVLVFESTDQTKGWDGKNISNGKEATEGVYFYVLTYNQIDIYISRFHTRKGSLTLMR